MSKELCVLLLEDSPLDAELIRAELQRGGLPCRLRRVETRQQFLEELSTSPPDVILADYSLPAFDGLSALHLAREKCPELPFVFVSGSIGEDRATELVSDGPTDYVLKDRLARLAPAVLRSIRAAEERSARRRAEDALREANRQLRAALEELKATQAYLIQEERLKAIGQMASGIAHDFNNSLLPILGFSELLLRQEQRLDETVRARLRMIHTAASDAAAVVRRLADFCRPQEHEETFVAVDVNALVKEAVALTQPRWQGQAQGSGITIAVEQHTAVVPLIFGDAAELREALVNLLLNAVDAMPTGGTLTVGTGLSDGGVEVQVGDTGLGMSREVQSRCFEPFFTTKGGRGSGMGLTLVHGVVQRHGGQIRIASRPGLGTTFTLAFPVPTGQVRKEKSEPVAQTSGPPLHVLCVDDDPLVRAVVSGYLAEDGHTFDPVGGGEEALARFAPGRYDLVLLDRAMPEMSGDHLALQLRKVAPDQPIVMLTGFADLMRAEGTLPPGVDVLLRKPISPVEWRKALAGVPRRRPPAAGPAPPP
ncbi:MAG: response regulator [Planctomycetes bacterium]|nr:response regulator [Planctomycetota bacterium]